MESNEIKYRGVQSPQRDSNLELYRILLMLFIIAHHYVIGAGAFLSDGLIVANPLDEQSIFLLIFGMWGKTGINCFVLITGYFMCKSKISGKKFMRLLCELLFYKYVFYILFMTKGYSGREFNAFVKAVLPFTALSDNFAGCYLVFYLLIPYLNKLIKVMTEKQYLSLLGIMCFVYVIFGSVPEFIFRFNYIGWFCVVYLIGAYFRLYPKRIFQKTEFWGAASVVCIILSIASALVIQFANTRFGLKLDPLHFVHDSNKIMAVLTSISTFLFFKNVKIRNSSVINTVASSIFGVLLIHTISYEMREWLWHDVLNNAGMLGSRMLYLHALCSVIGVFAVCTVIDQLRIRFLEEKILGLPIIRKVSEKISLLDMEDTV